MLENNLLNSILTLYILCFSHDSQPAATCSPSVAFGILPIPGCRATTCSIFSLFSLLDEVALDVRKSNEPLLDKRSLGLSLPCSLQLKHDNLKMKVLHTVEQLSNENQQIFLFIQDNKKNRKLQQKRIQIPITRPSQSGSKISSAWHHEHRRPDAISTRLRR